MTKNEIADQIKNILVVQGIAKTKTEIEATSTLRTDLGLDEVQIIELVGAIDEIYGITLDADEVEKAETVEQLAELIQRTGNV